MNSLQSIRFNGITVQYHSDDCSCFAFRVDFDLFGQPTWKSFEPTDLGTQVLETAEKVPLLEREKERKAKGIIVG